MADGVRWLTLFIVERIHEHQKIAEHGGVEVDVVVVMTALAAGELDHEALARWLRVHGNVE